MADLGSVVARNVRALRAAKELKQQELADLLNWDRTTLSQLETGRRGVRVSELPDLCRALHVPLSELVRGADARDLRALSIK